MFKIDNKLIEFKCIVKTERYNSENFKIYVVSVDNLIYPNIKGNKKGEVVLVGNSSTPNMIPNIEYNITSTIEINKNFGIQYKVKSARKDKPADIDSSRKFLYEIITPIQADTLLNVYPNIIDKIIRNDLNDVDLNKTKGIKDKTFNNIKKSIIENFALIELVDLFNGLIPISVIKKLYENYTSVNIVKNQLKNNPYKCLCSLSRIGFKTADKILLELDKKNDNFRFSENLLTSKQRMKACINYILEDNESNGNTKITIQDLRKQSNALTPECINKFVDIIKENDEDIYVNNELKCVSTKKAMDTEKYIANKLLEMKSKSFKWNINTEIYREAGRLTATNEQMETLNMMCNSNIGILTACGGSGKTASVNNLLNMLDDNNKTHLLCTPTGKSSEVLSEQTNREAGTIHRQLKFNPRNENPWTYNKDNKLEVDMVIIDEFSMVDVYLFKHLLEAIDVNKTKLLLVFDNYQLPSVGCGNIAQDLLDSNTIPVTRLTKIFRYSEGGLMQVVTKIRNGEQFLSSDFSGVEIFGTKKDFVFVELQQQKIINQVLRIYTKLLNDRYTFNDIMVLSCQNKGEYGTKSINKSIQYMLQKNKNNKFVIYGDNKFFKNDKVIQIVNNYKAKTITDDETEIFNGNTGIIIDVDWNSLTVDFGDGKYIIYDKNELSQLELGYCMSIHRSQGDACKQIICLVPKAHSFMLNSNLLYVAGTRARQRVYMIGNIITVNRAIKKKNNLQRNTFLKNMLIA